MIICPIPKFRIYCMIIAFVAIIVLVSYQISNVTYSYTIKGEEGAIGLTGYLLWFLYSYLSFELTFLIIWPIGDFIPMLLFVVIQPFLVVVVVYSKYFNAYSDEVKEEMMNESHVNIGFVYNVRTPIGKGTYHKEIKVGIDKEYKSKHQISNTIFNMDPIKVGDTVLLRVSDEYPRVTEVLKWYPTREEIERFKTPRKFKSCINGIIYEEEE